MPKIWCVLLIQDTEDIWLPPLCSEEECQPKKLMNKCLMSKTKTLLISLSGFQITSNHPFVIFLQKVWKWLVPLLVTPPLSKKCLKELLNNLLPCLEEKLSYIGILVKVWTKWNSLKLNPTWMIWYQNINNIKMLLLKKKENSTKVKMPVEMVVSELNERIEN